MNNRQTDWAEWLALTEFAHNSQTTSATGVSLFLLNYEQQPIIPNKQVEVQNESTLAFVSKLKSHHQAACQALEKTAIAMKRHMTNTLDSQYNFLSDRIYFSKEPISKLIEQQKNSMINAIDLLNSSKRSVNLHMN